MHSAWKTGNFAGKTRIASVGFREPARRNKINLIAQRANATPPEFTILLVSALHVRKALALPYDRSHDLPHRHVGRPPVTYCAVFRWIERLADSSFAQVRSHGRRTDLRRHYKPHDLSGNQRWMHREPGQWFKPSGSGKIF